MVNLRGPVESLSLLCMTCRKHTYNSHDIDQAYCSICGFLLDAGYSYVVLSPESKRRENQVKTWCVYKNPHNFPSGYYVARPLYDGREAIRQSKEILAFTSLDELREIFKQNDFLRMVRMKEDSPRILETWL